MTRAIRASMLAASVLTAAAASGVVSRATADVTSVTGSAYGYSLQVSILGSPAYTRGYGQIPCVSTNNPPGCVPAADADASSSPSVALDAAGGTLSASKTAATAGMAGPATFFSASALSAGTSGSIGPGGSVTSTSSATGVNRSGEERLTASSVTSTCTAREGSASGSTTVAGGTVVTDNGLDLNGDDDFNDSGEHGPTTVNVPANPEPGHRISGHLHFPGAQDDFELIFNEQVENGDGSLTVNAVHQVMKGDSAVGDLYVGRSVCGVVGTGTPPPADVEVGVSIDDSPDPVAAGGTVTYNVSVANTGSDAATDVSVLNTLTVAKLVSAVPSVGTCTVLKGKTKGINCALGTIAGGSSTSITIVATAPKRPRPIGLSATATATGDTTSNNNLDTESTAVT